MGMARPIRLDSPTTSGTTLSCSYLPRTRMRMLNSSAVLNGQPAILAWSVTSIQLPPETIQACPINQPVHYPAIPEPTPIPAFALCLPLSPLSLILSLSLTLHPSSLNAKPLSVPVLAMRASSHLSISPQPPSTFLADCPFHVQPRPRTGLSFPPLDTSQLHPTCTPILYAPYRQFFFPPSRICAWGLVRSMKVLPDGARRATYIIVKHAMRAIPAWRLEYRKCPLSCLRARFFLSFDASRGGPRPRRGSSTASLNLGIRRIK